MRVRARVCVCVGERGGSDQNKVQMRIPIPIFHSDGSVAAGWEAVGKAGGGGAKVAAERGHFDVNGTRRSTG